MEREKKRKILKEGEEKKHSSALQIRMRIFAFNFFFSLFKNQK